jgi:HEAT repeat protein
MSRKTLAAAARNALLAAALLPMLLLTGPAALPASEAQVPAGSPAARLDRALAAENLVNARYYYTQMVHVTGAENLELLSQVANLSLVEDVRRGKGWIRIEAASFLARRGSALALDVLRTAAANADLDPSLRRGAIKSLGSVDDPESLELLEGMVADLELAWSLRLAAMDAALERGSVSPLPYLSLLLRSGSREERLAALGILGDRRAPARGMLQRAAEDREDPDARFLALRALALSRDAGAIRALKEDFGEDPDVVIPVKKRGGESAEAGGPKPGDLVDLDPVFVLYRIAEVLLEVGDPAPMGFLEELIHHEHTPYSRGDLAAKVSLLNPVLGEKLLREVLASGGPMERIEAAKGLHHLGKNEGIVEPVAQIYREWVGRPMAEQLRTAAVKALGSFGLPEAVPVLKEALADGPRTQVEAARALSRFGNLDGLRPLRKLLEASSRVNALLAAEALVEMGAGHEPAAGSSQASGPDSRP